MSDPKRHHGNQMAKKHEKLHIGPSKTYHDPKNQEKAAAAPQRQQWQWQPTVEDEAMAAVLETEVE